LKENFGLHEASSRREIFLRYAFQVHKKLLVVGSINIDLVACANRLPAPGETILGSSFDVFNGGKGANQAVAIAKLGVPVDMIASLGTDLFTERLLSGLKAAGVDTHAVQMAAGPCGVAHISRADNGENSIIVVSGANRLVSPDYIDTHLDTVQQASMILVQLETPLETVLRLAEQAWEAKTPLMLDPLPPGHCPKSCSSARAGLRPMKPRRRSYWESISILLMPRKNYWRWEYGTWSSSWGPRAFFWLAAIVRRNRFPHFQ
jgi:ribokinase